MLEKWYTEKGLEMIEISKIFKSIEDLANCVEFLNKKIHRKEFELNAAVEGGISIKVSCLLPEDEDLETLKLMGWVLPEKGPIPEGYVEVKIGSMYHGSHHEYGEGDEYGSYYCHPEDVCGIHTIPLVHWHRSFDKDKAKKFFFFCLEHNVLDEWYNNPTNTEKFSIVGVQGENLPELLREWLEEYKA